MPAATLSSSVCWCEAPATRRVIYAQKSDGALRGARVCTLHVADEQIDIEDMGHQLRRIEVLGGDTNACAAISPEGLICTMERHTGAMHRDQSDRATEIEWHEPRRPAQAVTLAELVADVDHTVHSRAGALLAQAGALGFNQANVEVDETQTFNDRGVLARFRQIFPGRRTSPGARRTGT